MGTHPIFESDFDCLTDESIMSKLKRFIWTLLQRQPRQALHFKMMKISVITDSEESHPVTMIRPAMAQRAQHILLKFVIQSLHLKQRQISKLVQLHFIL